MANSEIKQRKTNSAHKQNRGPSDTLKSDSGEETKKVGVTGKKTDIKGTSSHSSFDFRVVLCMLSVTACIVLAWVVLQQNARIGDVEERYKLLYEKSAGVLELETNFVEVSKKCENVQAMLRSLEDQVPWSHMEGLEQEVLQLKEWSSGLTKKWRQLEENLTGLSLAVKGIEDRTSAISNDITAKVASVRTDVRRMAGLESEVQTLLAQTGELEEKVSQAERLMIKRIGDLLAGSIDRISSLKTKAEKNSQSLEQMRKSIPQLIAADKQLSERILSVESGRAKLIKTVTFASDLKPKVFSIKKGFALLEPQLADLTLRIGRLAEDIMQREEDIAQVKESLANFTAVQADLMKVKEELTQVPDLSDTLHQNDARDTLVHTHKPEA
ncbi:inhibitor of nuclear factor kappa-B kinase-interacting protein isoform X2 [Chanos chanos]|uniref:Inhibitor of nuclear factor kappa-B kinase-interacting protein isoform X2 n=1 Tax=Chanos chanos TaxID=29144 RepID=A0A6J2VM28_CHACN|nr:inhibitor of nuclear factor kappa-B kinase-interacting protein isoform X2 [Chanos chanos]